MRPALSVNFEDASMYNKQAFSCLRRLGVKRKLKC